MPISPYGHNDMGSKEEWDAYNRREAKTQEENMTTSDTLEKEAADFIDASPGIFSPFNSAGRPLTTLFADFTRLKVEQAKKQIAGRVEKAFREYRCIHHPDLEGNGLGLDDVLTPSREETVKLGREELDSLIDFICGEIVRSQDGK